jgi:hypothetical protein
VATVPLLAALFGMLGAGLGQLLRNTAAALGVALMWAFVIEGIIPALTHQPGIIRWLPEAAQTPCCTAHPRPRPHYRRARRSRSWPGTRPRWPARARH